MNQFTKFTLINAVFVGILTTPTFAFDHDSGPASVDTIGLASSIQRSPAPASELKKIAAQLAVWDSPTKVVREDVVNYDDSESFGDEGVEGDEETQPESGEIKKLDNVFRDYVMAKYMKFLRR